MNVYLLSHLRVDEEDENLKLCGIYQSEQDALLAIQRLSAKPGFKDFLEGFHISEYEVGHDRWTEGFGFGDD